MTCWYFDIFKTMKVGELPFRLRQLAQTKYEELLRIRQNLVDTETPKSKSILFILS
jgi:hypothetical protein